MTPMDEYRIEVRQNLGDGHEVFTDDQIDAVKDTFVIMWPQAWRVARRLRNLYQSILSSAPTSVRASDDTRPVV